MLSVVFLIISFEYVFNLVGNVSRFKLSLMSHFHCYFAHDKVLHRKLCARNVFLCGTNGRAVKVGGFGIADFAPPNEEIDVTRWTAQESLRSRSQSQLHYASKCDVWSFGCTMWEIATLGM